MSSLKTPGVSRSTVLNLAVLEQLRRLDEETGSDILRRVIGVFLDTTPAHLAALRRACMDGDATTRKEIAHSLKGSSGNLGADRLAELLMVLEDSHEEIGDLLLAVEEGFREAAAELRRIRDEGLAPKNS